mmetsp:Transcript_58469/g.143385  ORF Transcript_58469/g.143385 Transcript_58469/m.143385 type:complete len:340 (-) Transcript_58469:56-1075(-)
MGEAQNTLGLFSFAPSINVGDPYKDGKGGKDPRMHGKQFTTQPPKEGKTPDVTFSLFETLAVGDPYVELAVQQRRARNENNKKQIVPVPFKPSSPTKRPVGHGSYYGSFGIWPNVKTTDEYDKRPRKPGGEVQTMKNILTSPPKRGTYGMVGTNIGGTPSGVMGEYKYSSEPVQKRPETAPTEKLRPFVPASPPKRGTYGYIQLNINGASRPQGSQGEYTYVADPIHKATRMKGDVEPVKPFRPSQPPKKGRGYFGTFKWSGQEYVEDPEKEKWEKARAERMAAREGNMGLTFKPSSHPKSMRTISVANHPRNQDGGHPAAVNARIFMAKHGQRPRTTG